MSEAVSWRHSGLGLQELIKGSLRCVPFQRLGCFEVEDQNFAHEAMNPCRLPMSSLGQLCKVFAKVQVTDLCNFLNLGWKNAFCDALLPARFHTAPVLQGSSCWSPRLTREFGDLLPWSRHSLWGCISDEPAIQWLHRQSFHTECLTAPEKDPPSSQCYSIQSLKDLQTERPNSHL